MVLNRQSAEDPHLILRTPTRANELLQDIDDPLRRDEPMLLRHARVLDPERALEVDEEERLLRRGIARADRARGERWDREGVSADVFGVDTDEAREEGGDE